jgi:SAM-dependent methyltransferase
MQIPQWKKWLSYLIEMHIESAPSPTNPHLYVSLKRGRYQLSTARAIYSYGDLYDNFNKTFQAIRLDKWPVENVLLLGLGLGSIPFMLERNFHKNYQYTAVEIDEAVAYLAHKYVLSGLQSPIETVCANALDYVDQCRETFDLIAMDIFLEDHIPDEFETEDFLRQLAGLLSPNGILLYNRLSRTKEDLDRTRVFYRDVFSVVFPNAAYVDAGGNWVLINRADCKK